jgi:hypothetical protein
MKISKHLLDLIQKLKEKTISRKIAWNQTSRETEFQASFTGATITTDNWDGGTNNKNVIDFCVYNKDGVTVDRLYFLDGEQEYELLLDFYSVVKSSYLKLDETYNSLFDDLDKL